jgi:hypothetical protein
MRNVRAIPFWLTCSTRGGICSVISCEPRKQNKRDANENYKDGKGRESLNIAGGVILFIIALRLICKHPGGIFGDEFHGGEPFIVPLAIPSIAGPTAIATVVLMVAQAPDRVWECAGALTVSAVATLLLLLFAERIRQSDWHTGARGTGASDGPASDGNRNRNVAQGNTGFRTKPVAGTRKGRSIPSA